MTLLAHDRYCDEIVTQTDLLRKVVEGADLSVTVPTTPDWTIAQLLRHVGGNLRAVETAVRTDTAIVEPAKQVPEVAGPAEDDPTRWTPGWPRAPRGSPRRCAAPAPTPGRRSGCTRSPPASGRAAQRSTWRSTGPRPAR
jgi:hypothetical protein